MATSIEKTAKPATPKVITPKTTTPKFTSIWTLTDLWCKSLAKSDTTHALITKAPRAMAYNPGPIGVEVKGEYETFTGEKDTFHLAPTYTPLLTHEGVFNGVANKGGGSRAPGSSFDDLARMGDNLPWKVEVSTAVGYFIYNEKGNKMSSDSVSRAVVLGKFLACKPLKSLSFEVTVFPPAKASYTLSYKLSDLEALGVWGLENEAKIPVDISVKVSENAAKRDKIFTTPKVIKA